jgi:Trichohyalin-plectin-homology domain
MERAHALRDAREAQRQQFVQERLDAQWRDACDDARLLDSKALTMHMHKERLGQIQEKIRLKKQLSADENEFMKEWKRQLDVMHQQDLDKRAKQHRADMDNAAGLKEQMEYRKQKALEDYAQMMKDAEDELADVSIKYPHLSQSYF